MMYLVANVTVDVFCIVLMLLFIFAFSGDKQRKRRLNQTFIYICLANLGMLLGDLPNWLCEGLSNPWFPAALRLGCFIQFFCGVLLPLAYNEYVKAYLTPRVKVNPLICRIIYGLSALGILFVSITPFTGALYFIDSNNIYHRGAYWLVSQIIAVAVIALDTCMIIYYKKHIHPKAFCAFLGYTILPVNAVVLQSLIYGIAVTYAAATLSIVIIYLNIQAEQALLLERQQHNLSKMRMSIMISQIQPHFLYNSLATIRELCRINPPLAEHAINEFSNFLRGNLDALGATKPIPFAQDLEHTKTYLALEEMRFGDRLQVIVDTKVTNFRLPCLTLQPIVENAVRYGINSREFGGTVSIRTLETSASFVVVVTDDGVGFNPSLASTDGKHHIGISNVRNRLSLLCNGTLEVASTPGVGTQVMITIPKEAA